MFKNVLLLRISHWEVWRLWYIIKTIILSRLQRIPQDLGQVWACVSQLYKTFAGPSLTAMIMQLSGPSYLWKSWHQTLGCASCTHFVAVLAGGHICIGARDDNNSARDCPLQCVVSAWELTLQAPCYSAMHISRPQTYCDLFSRIPELLHFLPEMSSDFISAPL